MTLRSNIPSYIGKNVVFMFSFALISCMINLMKYLHVSTTLDNKFTTQKRQHQSIQNGHFLLITTSENHYLVLFHFINLTPPFIITYSTDAYLPRLLSVCFQSLRTKKYLLEKKEEYTKTNTC